MVFVKVIDVCAEGGVDELLCKTSWNWWLSFRNWCWFLNDKIGFRNSIFFIGRWCWNLLLLLILLWNWRNNLVLFYFFSSIKDIWWIIRILISYVQILKSLYRFSSKLCGRIRFRISGGSKLCIPSCRWDKTHRLYLKCTFYRICLRTRLSKIRWNTWR